MVWITLLTLGVTMKNTQLPYHFLYIMILNDLMQAYQKNPSHYWTGFSCFDIPGSHTVGLPGEK